MRGCAKVCERAGERWEGFSAVKNTVIEVIERV